MTPHSKKHNFLFAMITSGLPVLLVWILLFWEHFPVLLRQWNSDDYSYCYIVPFLTGYLLYLNKAELFRAAGGSKLPGFMLLLAAMVVFFAGRLGALNTLVFASMWMSLSAFLLIWFGRRSFRHLAFPLLILVFAIPAPPFITSMLTLNLQLMSTELAVSLLHLLGISAVSDGNIIDLGLTQLQVVEACSGLRYMFPTILLSLVLGYFFLNKFWLRTLLFLISAPAALVANAIRLALTGILVHYVSPKFAEGFLHDMSGWLVYMLSILILSIFTLMLRLIWPQPSVQAEHTSAPAPPPPGMAWVAGSLVLLLLVYGAQYMTITSQFIPDRKPFTSFPMRIGDWEGERIYLDQKIMEALWADDYVTGSFRNKNSNNLLYLLIPYYESQTTQNTAHAPTSCLLGSGWILESKRVLAPNPSTGRTFPVVQMLMTKGDSTIVSNFWFEQRGRLITSEYLNKFYLFWDAVTRRRSDGALVRVEMILNPGQTLENGQDILDVFLVELRPMIEPHVPR